MLFRIAKDEEAPIIEIVNPISPNAPRFPVYRRDTLEDTLKRWQALYPTEATALLADMKTDGLFHEKGLSKQKALMLHSKIPAIVYWAMRQKDHHYWAKEYKSNFREFRRIAPKLCGGQI